jgi:transcriptional regulator with XRE-family HTH domain
MNLGNTIKTLRTSKGIKQGTFAQSINLSQTYLSQIENNRKEPTIQVLKEIGYKLDVPLPIIFFLSMDTNDIPFRRRSIYNLVAPPINSFIEELFSIKPEIIEKKNDKE